MELCPPIPAELGRAPWHSLETTARALHYKTCWLSGEHAGCHSIRFHEPESAITDLTESCPREGAEKSLHLQDCRETQNLSGKATGRAGRWNRLPREAAAAPSLAGFKARLDEALSNLGWWKMSLLMAGGLEPDDL